jgi:5-methylcytosine-specific restriction endonuclease McrA
LRLKCAGYREQNLERENARSRAARSKERAADPAAANARIYAFLKKNPEKAAAYASAARAKRLNSGGSHTAADIKRTWNQQGHKCNVPGCTNPIAAIGKHKYHVDHIKALANGGTNYPENIQCLCGRCNARKSAQDEYAWAQREIGTLFVL